MGTVPMEPGEEVVVMLAGDLRVGDRLPLRGDDESSVVTVTAISVEGEFITVSVAETFPNGEPTHRWSIDSPMVARRR